MKQVNKTNALNKFNHLCKHIWGQMKVLLVVWDYLRGIKKNLTMRKTFIPNALQISNVYQAILVRHIQHNYIHDKNITILVGARHLPYVFRGCAVRMS